MSELLGGLGAEQLFFYPMAALCLGSAAAVIIARSPLYSALSLVCSFFFLAGIFVLLAGHLIGILQILVYAGAIMVLFLFVIMLLALNEMELGRRRTALFKLFAALSTLLLLFSLGRVFGLFGAPTLAAAARPLPDDFGTAAAVGRLLFVDYLLPFEVVSLLLLVAIAGAVVVAKRRI